VKILVSWSSGKDSASMLHVLRTEGIGEPGALLTTVNESARRVAMHAVRTEVLQAQADAAGLPLITVNIPHPCPNDVYEAQMSAAIANARANGFTHVAFGDLFLEEIRSYREARMKGTGLTPIFPLWLRPTDTLARDMLEGGLEAYLTCVDPRVVPASLAGRSFDARLLSDLPPGTDPCGERG
jgi:diphthamide synthase (EF-2-diphthine--ammonia ligase)